MVLVASTRDQNELFYLIAHQADILYSVFKDIAPKEALIWWNANEYAAIMGTRPLAKPADAPASSEETPPPGRQLRPRICPNCQEQRSSCTCATVSRKKTAAHRGAKAQQVVETSREIAAGASQEKDVMVVPGPSNLPVEMPTPESPAQLRQPTLSSGLRSAASRKQYISQTVAAFASIGDISQEQPHIGGVLELSSSGHMLETDSGNQSALTPSKSTTIASKAATQAGIAGSSSISTEAETIERPSLVPIAKGIKQEWARSMSESSQQSSFEGFERLTPEIEESVRENKRNIYSCQVCLESFDSIMKLNQHIPSHSATIEGHISLETGGRRKKTNNVCRVCSKVFISPGKLSQHMETHANPPPSLRNKKRSGHTCRVCSKVFNTPAGLSSHMHSAHPSPGSSSGAGEATPGTSVVASGSGVKKKGVHMCPICSKVFGSPGKLSQHMYSHTGERPFACKECDKAFSSKFKLVRHALIHSSDSERRYRCSACDRSFHRKDHLQNHAKVHSVVRARWRCERCGREYGSPLSHRRHLALHAAQDDGALDCGVCGRHFNSTDDILHHLKVHAGSRTVKSPADRKFRCDHCERRFFTRKDVRRHLVVHTGKRDFLCQFCPQRFGRKDHLVRHIKKSHHQGSLPTLSRTARGGRKLRLASPSLTATSSKSVPVEQLQATTPLYEGSLEEPALLSSTPVGYVEQKAEEGPELSSQSTLLEDTSLQASAAIQTMLHSTPVYPVGEVIPKSEESSLLPTVSSMEQPSGSQLPIVYAHPPPPYPSGDIQSQQFKVYEEENREGMIKLEPAPSSSRTVDIMHILSLIPSTSQPPVLSETLSALDQDSLLLAAQQLRGEDIQRLLTDTGGAEHVQLLTGEDPSLSAQLVHLIETVPSPVVELAIPSGTHTTEADVMAALLTHNSGQAITIPLPRFTQAFQSQHQSQQQSQEQQQQQQQPESSQQQQQQQQPPPPSEREQR